ncbi:CD209 antigen-like protein A [Leptodactylus fuscus]
MPNIHGTAGKGDKEVWVCGFSDDDEADDYENVIDNRKEPAVPQRLKKESKATGKREDLQLKYMSKPANSEDRADYRIHGPRTVPPFQPPPIGLDFTSPAVNAAFRDDTVDHTSEKKHTWHWKEMALIFCLVLMFIFWILLTIFMFIYYSSISRQLEEMKKNVNEITALRSDVLFMKIFLGLCTSCPTDWTLLGSSCYFFSTSHQTWENSQKDCKRMDSSLLILSNKNELDALRPLIGNKRFWIGLKKFERNSWRWVDGTIPVYTNWNRGEPNNYAYSEHCTEMIAGGWNDLECSKTIDYVCKKSPKC